MDFQDKMFEMLCRIDGTTQTLTKEIGEVKAVLAEHMGEHLGFEKAKESNFKKIGFYISAAVGFCGLLIAIWAKLG